MPIAGTSWSHSAALRTVAAVLLTCAGYYLAGLPSLIARFPSSGISTIWLASAIPLVALMLAPIGTWWLYVLAILPTHLHLVLIFQGPVPLPVMLSQFAGNLAYAVIVAVLMRHIGGDRPHLGGLRHMLAFILGGLAASCAVSALVVYFFQRYGWIQDFWLAWRARSLGNACGTLMLAPVVLWAARGGVAAVRHVPARRYGEFGLLLASLIAVGIATFGGSSPGPGSQPAILYAPLPLLLWASVRFGTSGLCASLLLVAVLSLSNAMGGRGPFISQSPVENTLSLQLFLLAVAMPLLLLSAVMEERKQALSTLQETEVALRSSYRQIQDLAGRLISAQEVERSRLARELHDDINQQLAALAIALSTIKRRLPSREAQEEVDQLRERVAQVSESIRDLSHELHPGLLRHAGLAAALKSHCAEFRDQYAIEIALNVEDGLDSIPQDVSLCLYRVAQEALKNVATHAHAHKARIILCRAADDVELIVADDGQGFDLRAARGAGGLGLISLDERVRLLQGSLILNSRPHRGTELRVRMPLVEHGRLPQAVATSN